ncbi:hypothetical protein LTR16_001738 [Cryomyces antarcticus]|uniref:Uncharacterized protein n=1 Tax=Cryomyces antarcticus TaxID=329879 RepID=A0ABR0M7X4_9PEZI|nr:hypothetical protein LTR60_000937 [Cryomyces antarcticus]KAK5293102.1 hypothetical protein LTR16_001738 [Cryomyces antarcticus]
MAKTKPEQRPQNSTRHHKKPGSKKQKRKAQKPEETPEILYAQAISLLETSQPEEALAAAQRLLALVQPTSERTLQSLPALNLLGEIHVELGNVDAARECFTIAASLDPEGQIPETQGGGAEKFLWLAQLCENGGAESVGWFEKGAVVLKKEVLELEDGEQDEGVLMLLEEKRRKLANALCGVVEVYMTDLSWEEDAEARCESLITEALLVAPEDPEVLQTLASVRISQTKLDDARAALARSTALWKDLEPEDPKVPDFPTRISLARLLMEVDMEDEAMEVLERLVAEDDSSVEAWYLGGWCLHLIGEKKRIQVNGAVQDAESRESREVRSVLKSSRDWLQNSLRLYQMLEYEDERLRDHALELVAGLNQILGEPAADGEEDADEDGWEDDDVSDRDEDMEGT